MVHLQLCQVTATESGTRATNMLFRDILHMLYSATQYSHGDATQQSGSRHLCWTNVERGLWNMKDIVKVSHRERRIIEKQPTSLSCIYDWPYVQEAGSTNRSGCTAAAYA